jgi:hypothetical protein
LRAKFKPLTHLRAENEQVSGAQRFRKIPAPQFGMNGYLGFFFGHHFFALCFATMSVCSPSMTPNLMASLTDCVINQVVAAFCEPLVSSQVPFVKAPKLGCLNSPQAPHGWQRAWYQRARGHQQREAGLVIGVELTSLSWRALP